MSQVPADWIAFFLFVLLFLLAILAEAMWLVRKTPTTAGRAISYTLLTDIAGLGIGSSIVFIIAFVLFMMVMGAAGRGGSSPEWVYWLVSAVALIFPPSVLILIKRVGLAIFRLRTGGAAWTYSVASSVFFIGVVLAPPAAFFFLFTYLSGR